MKKEIVYTDDYALLLSDEIPTNWYYDSYSKKVRHTEGAEYGDSSITKSIIAHRPLPNSAYAILEGVPLLPSFSWGQQDDVEKLAENQFPYPVDVKDKNDKIITTYGEKPFNHAKIEKYRRIWAQGYKEAKEKYKYTEEDILKVWNAAYIDALAIDEIDYKPLFFDNFIKSLQQPSRPTHFELDHDEFDDEFFVPLMKRNSQGQVELVGKYI